jgi:hypothetical protein
MRGKPAAMLAVMGLTTAVTCVTQAATLSLTTTHDDAPLLPGDVFQVTLEMSDLGDELAAGYIAFISFDPSEVAFVSGSYTSDPFGEHHIVPITPSGGFIALSAGIDEDGGQMPTSDDADLGTLTFSSIAGGCVEMDLPPHSPPTLISDPAGDPITPLTREPLAPIPSPRMSLSANFGQLPVEPGDFIVVTLSLTACGEQPAAGYQTFLEFDSDVLGFVHGSYRNLPFEIPIITPVEVDGETIRVAAGIDVDEGEPPFTGTAAVVDLTFESLDGGCDAPVVFAEHDPPTRLSDPIGDPITPLALDALPDTDCPADIVRDCVVDVDDLLALLAAWGDAGGDADINDDGVVNVDDLLMLLASWGPCLP